MASWRQRIQPHRPAVSQSRWTTRYEKEIGSARIHVVQEIYGFYQVSSVLKVSRERFLPTKLAGNMGNADIFRCPVLGIVRMYVRECVCP